MCLPLLIQSGGNVRVSNQGLFTGPYKESEFLLYLAFLALQVQPIHVLPVSQQCGC